MRTRRTRGCMLMTATAFAIGAPSAAAQDVPDITGTWTGTLVAGPQSLEIVFTVTEADGGTLTGTMDVPAQGAMGIPLTTVAFESGTLSMTFPVPGGGAYEGSLGPGGSTITGTFTQGGQAFPMELVRSDAPAPRPARPQEPHPPFPYAVEDVSFANEIDGVTLAGTLTLPRGDGPFPAAVLVSGSGPQDRNETLLGHKPFLVLSDHLTRSGVAVLRYDDRGVGESTGDRAHATTEHYAADALAAVAHLVGDGRIDPDAIGIVGHSEGGLIGPMAARRSDAVSYVVMLAGPGVSGLEVIVEQGRLINAAAGTSAEITDFNTRLQEGLASVAASTPDRAAAADRMRATVRDELERLPAQVRATVEQAMPEPAIEQTVAQMNSPWFRFFLTYDPSEALEEISVPVLALFGGKDLQVPPEQSAGEVEAALERGGNADATVLVLPGLNHLFQTAATGSPAEYQTIEETFNADALAVVSRWIMARFGTMRTHDAG